MPSQELEKCLKQGKIKPFSRGKVLVEKELESAKLDLKSARESFKEKNYKWSTIQTYYSMFHSARAFLYNKNYRERSHYCLIEALRNLYVKPGILGFWLIEALQKAKRLKEGADYYGDFNEQGAKQLLTKAEEFLKTAKEQLLKK